jgi:hypothetical protein
MAGSYFYFTKKYLQMAKLVQIHTNLQHRANSPIMVGIGDKMLTIAFDADCNAEVSEDILVELIQNDSSLKVLDEDLALVIDKEENEIVYLKKEIGSLQGNVTRLKTNNENLIRENEELKIKIKDLGGDPTIEESKVSKVDLSKMTVSDLQGLAKEAELPEGEYIDLKKKELVDYLFGKMNES